MAVREVAPLPGMDINAWPRWATLDAEAQDRELVRLVDAGASFDRLAAWVGCVEIAWVSLRLRQARERIALNQARDARATYLLESARRRQKDGELEVMAAAAAVDEDHVVVVGHPEDVGTVWESIPSTERRDNELLRRDRSGHGLEQLAEWMGCTKGTVYSRLSYARNRARVRASHSDTDFPYECYTKLDRETEILRRADAGWSIEDLARWAHVQPATMAQRIYKLQFHGSES